MFSKPSPSTVSRARNFSLSDMKSNTSAFHSEHADLFCGNSLDFYKNWDSPTVIVSDGGYGILGFDGDTASYSELGEWYEPHIKEWSRYALPSTTLWFWNTEVGWATVHPLLERYGWKYVNCNVWNKGMSHVAGNVNTEKIRRFPVVTELCVQYSFTPKINGMTLQEWLISEWKRTGLAMNDANVACGVKAAATRKYLTKDHLWYFPPADMFEKLSDYANSHGKEEGRPYFTLDGKNLVKADEWAKMRYKFHCPLGYTNVWDRAALSGKERIKSPKDKSHSAHLNQKPLDLMKLIIETSSDKGDVVWEPFGGLFSASLAASLLGRKSFGAEIDEAYFSLGVSRFKELSLLYV